MEQTVWALLPPVIAIVLALLTKEVYVSLFIGILSGALLYSGFQILPALETTFTVMGDRVGSNINIIVFLVLLGMIVALMTRSGASKAYGRWASANIKSRKGALYGTFGLGALIFVDDYFNCLTVGTVMRPVTDRHGVSRAKLAYVIDATAAPVCIIAPVSSWAAAVGSSLPEGSSIDGFTLFLQTIPFNYYALLTIVMVLLMIALNFDFGAMKKAETRDNDTGMRAELERGAKASRATNDGADQEHTSGKVSDLLIPIIVLIGACVFFMLVTGGLFEGVGIIDAFADCDSALSLVLGSLTTVVVIFFLYVPRRVLTAREFAATLPDGFRAMVPAILILTFAWTLSGICSSEYLDAGGFVSRLVSENSLATAILPPVFFLIALGLAFATGTSWGTFGILIPIAVAVFETGGEAMVLTVAAILAGAVCGDHISPISDTTILASTGADCDHLEHVATQMPYAMLVAACCVIGYIVGGASGSGWLGLALAFTVMLVWLFVLYRRSRKSGTRPTVDPPAWENRKQTQY